MDGLINYAAHLTEVTLGILQNDKKDNTKRLKLRRYNKKVKKTKRTGDMKVGIFSLTHQPPAGF